MAGDLEGHLANDGALDRYSKEQKAVIEAFFKKLAAVSNKTGKISGGRIDKIIASWEAYPAEAVIDGLNIYIGMDIPNAERGKGKNERYALGIIKNRAGETIAGSKRVGDKFGGRVADKPSRDGGKDEGERISERIDKRGTTAEELECGF